MYLPKRTLEYQLVSTCVYTDANMLSEAETGGKADFEGYMAAMLHPGGGFCNERANTVLDMQSDRVLQLSTCLLPERDGARFLVTCLLDAEKEQ